MGQMQQVDRDLGQRLMSCAMPAEARAVQHRLIEMWLDHARSGLIKAMRTGGKRKHDHDG